MKKSGCVSVIYVEKRNAKEAKVILETEKQGWIHKDYRMKPSSTNPEWVAIPINQNQLRNNDGEDQEEILIPELSHLVKGYGVEECPMSSARLGNGNNSNINVAFTKVQQGLFNFVNQINTNTDADTGSIGTKMGKDEWKTRILALDTTVCPKKLEYFGDDKTLVIPRRAFHRQHAFFSDLLGGANDGDHNDMDLLWKHLGIIHKSARVVKRGPIDPNSPIRQSGHRILWQLDPAGNSTETSRPDSAPGWITVTEQAIRQSFDMTKVMFSRGNITEKVRFGQQLVQEGEVILDMYAGIGYYTLPALIKGKAHHVHACEWNPHAAFALRHNLRDNDVADRASVHVGDCRESVVTNGLIGACDRVSLGLLPSSEGGWKTAISALRRDKGGWLHVHGNVPSKEQHIWALWVCHSLVSHCDELGLGSWSVICHHVERVKSFAPTVYHYVADIHVHPNRERRAGVMNKDGRELIICPGKVEKPSCALDHDGVLHQDWMM